MQDIFSELSQGNSKPFVEAMADDFRWIMMGTTTWSRTYEGKQAVITELFVPLRASLPGKRRTTAHRFIADGDYVAVEARGENITKAGLPYNNSYCMVFRIADGKMRELTEYLDTELVTSVLGDPVAA
jgi:ketosteroid isomerase-like protein